MQPGGTAPQAQVTGYRVARQDRHRAQARRRRLRAASTSSSFVGLAPVSSPRLIVAVMIDEPSAAATTAAPSRRRCSREVMGAALRMLGVPPDAPVDNVDAAAAEQREIEEEA